MHTLCTPEIAASQEKCESLGRFGNKLMIEVHRRQSRAPIKTERLKGAEEFLCWSKMQAEAGQPLGAILERKERERRAAGGLFFWGVGNAPALIVRVLARMGTSVPVVFSIMKSKPKTVDAAPVKIVVWRRYIDVNNVERPLPSSALVTSRAESASKLKTRHFALMCWSDDPLRLEHGKLFDPSPYRNAGGNGARVGASQVTALLRRVRATSEHTDYETNLEASLVDGYWVRLTDPRELSPHKVAAIACGPSAGQDWSDYVSDLRDGPAMTERNLPFGGLLI